MIRIISISFFFIFFCCSNNSTSVELENTNVFPTYISKDKLIAYYPFDGNVEDKSINHNDGFLKGTKFAKDKNGNALHALEFNGKNNQYIEVPFDSSINTPEEITISVWIYKESDTTFQAIISRYIGSNYKPYRGWNFAFRSSEFGGNLYFYFQDKTGNPTCYQTKDSIASVIMDGWHHIATTLTFGNGKKGKIYLDGQELETEWYDSGRNYYKMPKGLNNNLFIGLSKAGPNGARFHHLDGIIDELIIYSRKLGLKDIEKLRNGFLSQ